MSLLYENLWSQDRYQGLREAYKSASRGHGVERFNGAGFPDHGGLLPRKTSGSITGKWQRSLEPFSRYVNTFGKELPIAEYSGDLLHHLFQELGDTQLSIEQNKAVLPLFNAALSNPSISAWVCEHDHLAIRALYFLKGKDVSVPGRISVVGFYDTTEAFRDSLTSYNFNMHDAVVHMIDYVLWPNTSPRFATSAYFNIPGYIVQRESSGPARLVS
jgi:hypothetical protein